jgi:hypothetical protein
MKKTILVLAAMALVATASIADAGEKRRRHGNGNHSWNNHSFNHNNHHNTYKYKYNYGGNDNGWYAFGGFLGGLALGGAIGDPGYGYGADPYVGNPYVAPITPQQYCGTEWTRRWNAAYQTWENVPNTVCWTQ